MQCSPHNVEIESLNPVFNAVNYLCITCERLQICLQFFQNMFCKHSSIEYSKFHFLKRNFILPKSSTPIWHTWLNMTVKMAQCEGCRHWGDAVGNGREYISNHLVHSIEEAWAAVSRASTLLESDTSSRRALSNFLDMFFWLVAMPTWASKTDFIASLIALDPQALVLRRQTVCYRPVSRFWPWTGHPTMACRHHQPCLLQGTEECVGKV